VQVINLAAAADFAQAGLANHRAVHLADEGLDRQTPFRGGGDQGDIAQPGQRQVKRARDGGGGHGQDVRFAAELFQAFLLAHAEAVLFVNDDQPKTLEAHVFLQQPMGADDNVHRSVGERRQHLALIGRTAEA